MATNKARKARLASIARDRLGYQEYIELRDSIDRNITNLYTKLQKKDIPKLNKKKKSSRPLQGAAAASAANAALNAAKGAHIPDDTPTGPLAPCPAALGLTPDDDNHLTVNEQLKQLVETRRQWVDSVGSIFEQKEMEEPGRIYGLPKESIFQGVEEEVEAALATLPSLDPVPNNRAMQTSSPAWTVNGTRNRPQVVTSRMVANNMASKGKERAKSDAMDIG